MAFYLISRGAYSDYGVAGLLRVENGDSEETVRKNVSSYLQEYRNALNTCYELSRLRTEQRVGYKSYFDCSESERASLHAEFGVENIGFVEDNGLRHRQNAWDAAWATIHDENMKKFLSEWGEAPLGKISEKFGYEHVEYTEVNVDND